MELHKKDLQMLKNKVEEQECFASKIDKTVVDTGNDENTDVTSSVRGCCQGLHLIEDEEFV